MQASCENFPRPSKFGKGMCGAGFYKKCSLTSDVGWSGGNVKALLVSCPLSAKVGFMP